MFQVSDVIFFLKRVVFFQKNQKPKSTPQKKKMMSSRSDLPSSSQQTTGMQSGLTSGMGGSSALGGGGTSTLGGMTGGGTSALGGMAGGGRYNNILVTGATGSCGTVSFGSFSSCVVRLFINGFISPFPSISPFPTLFHRLLSLNSVKSLETSSVSWLAFINPPLVSLTTNGLVNLIAC